MVSNLETKILLLLSSYKKLDARTAPYDVTQAGISELLDIHVSVTSRYLKKLRNRGMVHEKTMDIEGEEIRRKAYFLTCKGKGYVKELERVDFIKTPIGGTIMQFDEMDFLHEKKMLIKNLFNNLELEGRSPTPENEQRKLQASINTRDVYYRLNDFKRCLVFARISLELAQKLNMLKEKADSHFLIADVTENQNKWDEAQYHLKEYLKITDEPKGYWKLGRIKWHESNYEKANEYYDIALEKAKMKSDIHLKVDILIDKANIYENLGEVKNALKLYDDAMKISKSIKYCRSQCRINLNLGRLYRNREDYKLAMKHYEKCINIAKKHNDVMGLGHGYVNGAYALIHMNKLSKAKEYNKRGYEIFFLMGDLNMLIGVKVNNALIERVNGNYDKAIAIFKECGEIFGSLKLKLFHGDVLFQIAKTYKLMEEKKKARKYFSQAQQIYINLKAKHKLEKIKKEKD